MTDADDNECFCHLGLPRRHVLCYRVNMSMSSPCIWLSVFAWSRGLCKYLSSSHSWPSSNRGGEAKFGSLSFRVNSSVLRQHLENCPVSYLACGINLHQCGTRKMWSHSMKLINKPFFFLPQVWKPLIHGDYIVTLTVTIYRNRLLY